MRTEIKICGLSTEATVEAALMAGADMIGLNFYRPSPRFVETEMAARLARLARGKALIVAVVVDEDDDCLSRIVDMVRPDILQLHGAESIARVDQVARRFSLPVMKAVGVRAAEDVETARGFLGAAQRIMLDAKPPKTAGALPGGNGLSFDWRLVSSLDPPLPFMLSGGLDETNVAAAINLVRPAGVDVSSGVESQPGVKDAGRITAFIAAARAAESGFTQ